MVCINITNLTLQDVVSSTLKNNPSKQFKERWGDEYLSRAMKLWGGVKECYLKRKIIKTPTLINGC
ncbi:hypothetical protein AOR04_18645 [Pseudoalteromonas sp. 1_2015MBL_MicDiv]|nr:hypothetical protein AOR04_18645 [Pseudoalteromonas sp. 1_2015MBL_MicDiv]